MTSILLIGPEVKTIDGVKNWSGVWSYFLARSLRAKGASVRFAPRPQTIDEARQIDFGGIDLAISLGVRGLSRYPGCTSLLRLVYRGKLTEIADRPHSVSDDEHLSFSFCICGSEPTSIGWAADGDLLRPDQAQTLRILIDHADYSDERIAHDRTAEIVRSALRFRSVGSRGGFTIRRQTANGFETVLSPIETSIFDRKASVPWSLAAWEYRKAHIFLVTHRESVGLAALECAMAGALVLAPKGFIAPDRLSTIRHLEYDGEIPWEGAVVKIDVQASRRLAAENSWARVAEKVLVHA